LSHHWARMGHDVTVLTGFPNHPTGVVPEEWRSRLRRLRYTETADRVRVVRTWLWPLPNRKAHERIRNYASFCVSAGISGLALRKPDVIIATSPQLLVALSGWWLAWWKRVPFVFEVRDLWPESLAAVGAGSEGSLLHRTLGAIAGFLYRRADRIVVVAPAFKDHLMRYWNVPAAKISVVENGVETDLFRLDPAAMEVRKQLKLEESFLICYIGTMGNAHGLETLIAAAEDLQTALPNAMFLLIGEGAEKERIMDLAAERGLTNIRFLDQQPRERIPAYVSAADVCLVMLKKTELFKTVIPTKLLEYMACERPVIVAVDGQARQIIEEAGGGVFVEPENSRALVKAILDLAEDPAHRRQMGASGRQYIVNRFSRDKTARDYITVLEALKG
jgi:colanic acid biosynthesis glycosyl transferase WcaI